MTDEFHRHEALDRTSMIAQMVGIWPLEHPAIQENTKVRRKIEKAANLLAEAYQQIGESHLIALPLIDPKMLEVGK